MKKYKTELDRIMHEEVYSKINKNKFPIETLIMWIIYLAIYIYVITKLASFRIAMGSLILYTCIFLILLKYIMWKNHVNQRENRK